jgi:organic hydroperoxide reductase OsmC/OhrA
MEPKMVYKVFRFQNEVCWQSGLHGTACAPGKPELEISNPPEFKGEGKAWSAEEMFVGSVNACTFMTFLAYARHKGLALVGYESDADGVLDHTEGKWRFTEITLHPHIRVKSQEDVEAARKIIEDAHADCFVTHSLSLPVKMYPEIRVG